MECGALGTAVNILYVSVVGARCLETPSWRLGSRRYSGCLRQRHFVFLFTLLLGPLQAFQRGLVLILKKVCTARIKSHVGNQQ